MNDYTYDDIYAHIMRRLKGCSHSTAEDICIMFLARYLPEQGDLIEELGKFLDKVFFDK